MFLILSSAPLWLGVSLILCHQILITIGLDLPDQHKSSAPVCRPFNQSSQLSDLCGYRHTALYISSSNEFDTANWLHRDDYFKLNPECTKTLRLLECGNSFPRCVSGVDGPYLPCRRVCHDFFGKCGEQLRNKSEWLYWTTKWSCNLLPEKDDPSTMDYRKRCFEPPSFKDCGPQCNSHLEPLKCYPLVVPKCQNFGYKFTIFPEEYQRKYIADGLALSNKVNNTFCSVLERKFECTASFPPCFEKNLLYGDSCHEDCLDFFRYNCSSPSFYKTKEKCSFLPMRLSPNDVVCKQTEWLIGWPEFSRRSGQSQPEGNPTLMLFGLLASIALVSTWFPWLTILNPN